MIDLTGTWLTSFSSFVHDDPADQDRNPAPQIAAYDRPNNNQFDQTAGYFLAATILCLKFADGRITGKVKINRGGSNVREKPDPGVANPVTGTYSSQWNEELGVTEGTFSTVYSQAGSNDINIDYMFIARSPSELEWLYLHSTSGGKDARPSVAQGTLRRVVPPAQPGSTAEVGRSTTTEVFEDPVS
jgi:hypothetical protein